MRKLTYLIGVLFMFGLWSCRPDNSLDGTENFSGTGQPMMLNVNLVGIGPKYKSSKMVDNPDDPSEFSECVVNDHTLFVFDATGRLLRSVYVVGDTPQTNIKVDSRATEIYVVANGGNIKDPNSFLGKAIGSVTELDGYKAKLLAIETNLADQKINGLLRTGASAITITEAAGGTLEATATIGLKYVTGKVVADWKMDRVKNTNLAGALLTGVYIINGRGESRIFGATLEDNGNNNSLASRTWGPLYNTTLTSYVHGKKITELPDKRHKYIDGNQEDLLLNDYSTAMGGGISTATDGGTNDFFYVLDNKADNIDPHANTLLVYEFKFANTPDIDVEFRGKTRYYTVNLNGYIYTTGNELSGASSNYGYSIRRGVRYTVTATISSNGTDNPLLIDADLKYLLQIEDWIRLEDFDTEL